MLIHPTVERLRALGLSAMADAFIELQNAPDAAELTREAWLGLLVDRRRPAVRTSVSRAGCAKPSCARPPSSKTSTCTRPAASTAPCFKSSPPANGCATITIWSSSGRPASASHGWLAPSATRPAARASRCSTSAPAACSAIWPRRRGEGRLPRLLTTLERVRLLIIDDWGPAPLNAEQRRDLLEIVDDRYDRGSPLITSQVPVSKWHEVIADPTLGDAILDRIVHRAHRIELKGPSLRRQLVAAESPAA